MGLAAEVLRELRTIIQDTRRVSAEVAEEVDAVLKEGHLHPLNGEELSRLLEKVVTVMRRNATARDDARALAALAVSVNELIERVVHARETAQEDEAMMTQGDTVELVSRNGIKPAAVRPSPVFHGREVPMLSGFARVTDISLWDENERLDIHLAQFREKFGRPPTPEELLDIMLSRISLPGIADDQKADQFEIVDLARSIAVNGVRQPPILDVNGTLLDGNRRVTACHYVLNSDEFSSEEKRRVEYIFVWQLTEHATEDQRDAVVVSLNFEPDHKQKWPEYVKGKKVYEEWQAMLAAEPRSPGPKRQAQMKRELSRTFALGPDTSTVNRYLKMVDWVTDFEEYHTTERSRDEYEVKHRASRYFQYFDELAKGERSGVAYILRNDEPYKHLVFDLLFQGKFRNWRQIRDLKFTYENDEAREYLRKARETAEEEDAEEYIDQAISIARLKRPENRSVGANTRIEVFAKWLEELPVSAFRDQITPKNLRRLLSALQLVEANARSVLEKIASESAEPAEA